MTIAKEVVYALHQRLKDLSVDATPDQLAYLAKSLESIAGQSTVLDIVQMTDEKLKELLDSAKKHLSDLDTSKANSLSAITAAKTESIDEINTLKTNSLDALKESSDAHISLLDTRKNTNIAAINSVGKDHKDDLKGLVDNFRTVNDVPDGSSIMKEIKNCSIIEPGSLPFVFGVLARYNHYWGNGNFRTELGKWYQDTAKTDNMLQLLTGSHNHSTSYVAFYKPPQLHFLQGKNGTFVYNELYVRYAQDANQYQYPYALLGVVFVKNTTGSDMTRTLSFVATSHWSSGYEGVGLFVGTPNNTDANKSAISAINWSNIYNYSSTNSYFTVSSNVQIPANKTVAIILYTTPYHHYHNYGYYSQYMQWGIYNFRSDFLTTGLEVDVERTLRAWQCPGLDATYKIWQ